MKEQVGVGRLEEHRKALECSDAFCRESQAGNGREAVVEQQGSADPATFVKQCGLLIVLQRTIVEGNEEEEWSFSKMDDRTWESPVMLTGGKQQQDSRSHE